MPKDLHKGRAELLGVKRAALWLELFPFATFFFFLQRRAEPEESKDLQTWNQLERLSYN